VADILPMADKIVLITGGTEGIGKATAIGLATLGARVGITGRDLARAELAAADIRATSLHPGVVRTNFGAEDQAWLFTLVSRVVLPLLKTPAQGAHTSIYLASSPDVDGVTDTFFANRKPRTANKVAYDTSMAARLWQVSADLVGLTPATP
jgi:NAD(P)-dependent dehydrogenase (short-subunit alcohol dehydrogenase family)